MTDNATRERHLQVEAPDRRATVDFLSEGVLLTLVIVQSGHTRTLEITTQAVAEEGASEWQEHDVSYDLPFRRAVDLPLPDRANLVPLIESLLPTIGDEYRASEDDETPGMCLTVGWNDATGRWGWQTGDNSFTGGAYGYPHWAVVTLPQVDTDEADEDLDELTGELADNIREQLADLVEV